MLRGDPEVQHPGLARRPAGHGHGHPGRRDQRAEDGRQAHGRHQGVADRHRRANVATLRLLLASGVKFGNVIACDSKGILHPERTDIAAAQDRVRRQVAHLPDDANAEGRRGGTAEAMRGTDVCIALSQPGPGTHPAGVGGWHGRRRHRLPLRQPHSRDLALGGEGGRGAHRRHGPLRLSQPGQQLAGLSWHLPWRAGRAGDDDHRRDGHRRGRRNWRCCAEERGLDDDHIVPTMDDWEVFPREASAVGMKAQEQGVARLRHHARRALPEGQGHHPPGTGYGPFPDGQRIDPAGTGGVILERRKRNG